MAFPVIRVDSTNGSASDDTASGAGPDTALTGTNATWSTNVVTLDGSPDLSGVASDGSHAIYIQTTTGIRFYKITSVNDGSNQVTTEFSVVGTSGQSWGIGGYRATMFSAGKSKLLFENGGSAGDAKGGWIVRMLSGHSETSSATITNRSGGDTTDGELIIEGEEGAATMPLLTFSNNGISWNFGNDYVGYQNFELKNTSATKTSATCFYRGINDLITIRNIKAADSTDNYNKFFVATSGTGFQIHNCDIGNMDSIGIDLPGSSKLSIMGNYIHDCGSHGINISSNSINSDIILNIIYNCGGDGIHLNTSTGDLRGGSFIFMNTIDSCTSDGIEVENSDLSIENTIMINNILSNNGGYGINFSNASHTAAFLSASLVLVRNNNTYNNTSGAYNPTGYGTDDPGLDPGFTAAASGNFSVGVNMKEEGYPKSTFLGSSSRSYVDIGAIQRQEFILSVGAFISSKRIFQHLIVR